MSTTVVNLISLKVVKQGVCFRPHASARGTVRTLKRYCPREQVVNLVTQARPKSILLQKSDGIELTYTKYRILDTKVFLGNNNM